MASIGEKLNVVKDRVAAACARAGRNMAEVRIVAVTKTVGVHTIRDLISLGVNDIGENRVQDAARKAEELFGSAADLAAQDRGHLHRGAVTLHLIGHLQTNKAAQAVRIFDVIHSVDSLRLAEAVSRAAVAQKKVMPVLLEVNISGEESKFGFQPEDAFDASPHIAALPGLRLDGLMTMAPLGADEPIIRSAFRGVRELAARISARHQLTLPHLSMGMSQDYELAIAEGATLLRIGTAIVG